MKKLFLILAALILASLLLVLSGCESTDKPTETEAPGTQPSETEDTAPNDTVYEGPEFFVAVDGSDEWPGSSEQPFATLKHAMETVHALRADGKTDAFTVTVREGSYKLEPFSFTAEDGGLSIEEPVIYRGEGNVLLDAGLSIPISDFGPVTDDVMLSRFDPSVADKIVCVDLSAYGITREKYGEMKAFGSAARPTGDEYRGANTSVFWNDERIAMARYPNDSKLYLPEDFIWLESVDDVIDPGVSGEYGGTLRLPAEANEHMSKWASLEDVWAFGYFMFDWADETTPVKAYDPADGTVTFLFPSYDGYGETCQYYFYNIAEELDVPGEYWVDRNSMMMYLYPVDDDPAAVVGINLDKTDIFTGVSVNTVFENFTIRGTCGNVFSFGSSDGLTVRYCLVKDCDGYPVMVYTANNTTVFGCEFCHLGKGGAMLNGSGDAVTLTHGNNLIENNYLHHIAEIQRMYAGGFELNGVGGTIRHNEIHDSPHSVLAAGGQENLIEWNYVHDIVQESGDAGAYYNGGRWHSIGNVIQYNKFENIGNETHNGTAIYFDDGMSGVTARYNLIIDTGGSGFILGGGRNIEIYNNLVIQNKQPDNSFGSFDQRMRTWYLEGRPNLTTNNAWWDQLKVLPYTTGIWAERYPNLAASHFDQTNIDDINFLCNPSYNVIKNNVLIGTAHRWSYNFEEAYYTYSTMENNVIYPSLDRIFVEGTYEMNKVGKRAIPEWEPIPTEGYGTYGEIGPR